MSDNVKLTDSEWKIISELWKTSPQTITQLVNSLKSNCDWSKSTVITLLNRMEIKSAIYFKVGTKARQYYPAITRAELVRTETSSFIEKVYNGNAGLLMSTLVTASSLSNIELENLYKLLNKVKCEQQNTKSI